MTKYNPHLLYSEKTLKKILDCLSRYGKASDEKTMVELDSILVPVLSSATEIEAFIDKQPQTTVITIYFMYKDMANSYLSTSRIHMNCLWQNMIYVPCNIAPEKYDEIEQIYKISEKHNNVVFINHTMPHKSNAVMRRRYGEHFGDYLVKNKEGFHIVDGNGAAFVNMSEYMLGVEDFSDVTIIIIGVGGAGSLALYAVKKENPKRIILVDVADKSEIANSVGAEYYNEIMSKEITGISRKDRLVIMDATSHSETRLGKSIAYDFLKKYDSDNNFFIDYNMRTKESEYLDLKTNCAMGTDYVAWTNYIMVKNIIKAARIYGIELPNVSKEEFDLVVKDSVIACDAIETTLFSE